MEPAIGERQTVGRALHPTLGEGRVVYRHGPAFFIADSGEVEHFARVTNGGASAGPPPSSWVTAHRADGSSFKLEQHGRDHGRSHDRVVTEDGRPGWLSWWTDEFGTWCHVFEGDDGGVTKFAASYWHIGHPKDRRKKKLPAARAHLMTIGGRGDFTFVYSREGDTPDKAAAAQSQQLNLLRSLAGREGAAT